MADAEEAAASDLLDLTAVAAVEDPPDPSMVGPGLAEPMASTQDSWSNIPPELAGLFLGRLHAHVDRVRFTAVCPQWRFAAQQVRLPPPLPLLALKPGDIFYSMPQGEPLHFAGCKNGFATTCGKWLVYQRFRELLLVDPFSGATMTLPAPSKVYLPGEDGCVDLDSCSCDRHNDSAYEVEDSKDGSTQCSISANDGEDSEGDHDSVDEGDYYDDSDLLRDIKSFKVIKLMVCSPNLIAALFQGSDFSWIAVCRPGASRWSVAWGLSLWITDMAFYQGKLYVVDYNEDLLALNISVDDNSGDPQVSLVGQVINVGHFDDEHTLLKMLYLVESCGSLLMVRRCIFHEHIDGEGQIHTFAGQCEPDCLIFEADFGRSQWVQVTSLADNQALFLGPCSRAVCLPQGDSPGNRVWFLDDYKDFHYWSEYHNILNLSDTSSVTNPKPFSPLPMISWKGYLGNAGPAWLFPEN